MKTEALENFGALLLILFVLGIFGLGIFSVYLVVLGLYLAFSSHVITGIIVLLVEPLPLIIGAVQFFCDHNIAVDITNFIIGL